MFNFNPESVSMSLFAGLVLTANATDVARVLPFPSNLLSLAIRVSAVTGAGATCTLSVQWSFNGQDWFDAAPADTLGTATAPVNAIEVFQVKAPYWRLKAVVGGTQPSFTMDGNAMYLG